MTVPVSAGPQSGRLPTVVAGLALVAITAHLLLRYVVETAVSVPGLALSDWPLVVALTLGGTPLVVDLAFKLVRRQFGSDLLAGISIVTAVILGELLAGTLVVLMLAGGAAREGFAVRRASSVLAALARRMPAVAHRKTEGRLEDVPIDCIAVGDLVAVLLCGPDARGRSTRRTCK